MIRPTKFLNLDNCVLKISAHILKILLKEQKISYSNLYLLLKDSYDDNFDYLDDDNESIDDDSECACGCCDLFMDKMKNIDSKVVIIAGVGALIGFIGLYKLLKRR